MSRSQQSILRDYGIKPVKRRGQNFLIDGNLSRAIADETLSLSDNVLELGAGGGALTVHLLARAAKVVCVEIDRNLCQLLQGEYGELPNFQLIEGDLANMDWISAVNSAGQKPVVAGNLPYVLTSKVLFQMADLRETISGSVFMVQKEVAERLVAKPGGRDFGILAVVLGSVFNIQIVRNVPASVFWPRPEVESAVIQLVPSQKWPEEELTFFKSVVKTLFGQRRKKLATQLRAHYSVTSTDAISMITEAGIDPDSRPEQATAEQFRKLAQLLAAIA